MKIRLVMVAILLLTGCASNPPGPPGVESSPLSTGRPDSSSEYDSLRPVSAFSMAGQHEEGRYEDERHGLDERLHQDEHGRRRGDLYRASVRDFRAMTRDAGTQNGPLWWAQIGPQPAVVNEWLAQNGQRPGPNSGAVVDIAIDPTGTTDTVMYSAANDGGVWKTTDGGVTWKPMTDDMDSLSIGAVAIDPGNPSIVYAGTGNIFNNGFFKAVGVYRSADGGTTWTITPGSNILNNIGINKMVMPQSGVLLVATNQGLYRSTDQGNTFTQIHVAGTSGKYITDLRLSANNPLQVWAAVWGVGIVASIDGGVSFPDTQNLWAAGVPGAPNSYSYGFVSVAPSSDGQTLYANASGGNGKAVGVWVSRNGGGSWTDISAAALTPEAGIPDWRQVNNCQCTYDQTLGVDPTDANRVYMGFQDLWETTDGGQTWSNVSYSYNGSAPQNELMHVDHHALVFSPPSHRVAGQPVRLWVGNDGGIWNSSDYGVSWNAVNQTIATNLFRGISSGQGATGNLWTYGGMQDTGTAVTSVGPANSTQWAEYGGGDGGTTATDHSDPQLTYGFWGGSLISTTNGGASFPTFGNVSCGNGASAQLNTDAAPTVNPSSHILFLAGTCNGSPMVFSSADKGTTVVSALGAGVPALPARIGNLQSSPADANSLWLGLSNGQMVHATINQGQITGWTAYAIAGGIGGQTPQLAVNPVNANVLMAVFAGYSQQTYPSRHVFLSSNGGVNWTDISGTQNDNSIPDMPIYDAVFDPNSEPHALIVASDLGVMRSRNNGTTWQVLGLGFPNVHATSLAIDSTVNPSLLKVGTFGRSAWQLSLNKEVQTCIDRDAGPLWNNGDAQRKCPSVCAGHGETWLGQWTTTVWGVQSVCGCCSGG